MKAREAELETRAIAFIVGLKDPNFPKPNPTAPARVFKNKTETSDHPFAISELSFT